MMIVVDIKFDPSTIFPPIFTANIAQLVRALDCGSEGHGFEPHYSPFNKNRFYGSIPLIPI